MRALLEEDFAEVVAFSETEVAALPVALSAARPDIRVQEMPIGNAICDAMLQALADQVRLWAAPCTPRVQTSVSQVDRTGRPLASKCFVYVRRSRVCRALWRTPRRL